MCLDESETHPTKGEKEYKLTNKIKKEKCKQIENRPHFFSIPLFHSHSH